MTKVTIGDRKEARHGETPDCDSEHDDLAKLIMSKMTVRMGTMMVASVAAVSAIMFGIAGGQVTDHKAQDHKSLLPQPEIEKKLESTEQRLEKKIDEVKGDLQGDITQIQNGQLRMENKLDHMMEILLDHDRAATP